MYARRNDILQGTLALLVLQTLVPGPTMYAIKAQIQSISGQKNREARCDSIPSKGQRLTEGVAPVLPEAQS